MSLFKKSVEGASWLGISNFLVAFLQFLIIIVLSRYLSKSEIGNLAIIQGIIGLIMIFLDYGINNALVFVEKPTQNEISTLYWVNILVGLFLTIIVFFIANPISWFYKSQNLVLYIQAISFNFVILSIARLYKFLLQKKLLFKSLAVCEIIANLFSFLLIILLLSFDYGFWAYIVGVLIRSMTLSFLYFYQGIGVFIPKFFCKIRIIKAYLAYGRYNMGQSFIVYFNSQLDNLLIGKLIGMEALGIYSLAKNLVIKPLQFINPVISRVLFPLLSNIRDDLDLVSKTFLNYTLVIGFLSCIVYSLMFAFSEEIVRMLYGEIWIESAGILKILSVGLMISSILNPQGSLLMSIGKVKLAFYWNIGLLIINPLIILSLSNYGPTGIAYGVVLYFAIQLFASYSIIIKPSIKTSKIELLTIFFTHFIAFLLNALIIYLVTNSISSDYIRIAVGIMLSLLIVTMVYFVFHGDKVNDFLKLILKWKKER